MKGDAVPLTSAHRELVEIFIEYLRRLPELGRNSEGNEVVNTGRTDPYYPLIVLLLNHFSVRDFGPSKYGKKYDIHPWEGLPSEITVELFDWFHSARFVDPLTERKRAVLHAEWTRRRAGETWDDYVEQREELGLKPAEAPWKVERQEA